MVKWEYQRDSFELTGESIKDSAQFVQWIAHHAKSRWQEVVGKRMDLESPYFKATSVLFRRPQRPLDSPL